MDLPGSRTFRLVLNEAVDFGDSTIEGNDFEAVVGGVHDEVLAHDGQANEAEISTGIWWHRRADIDAGQSRSTVSQALGSIQLRIMCVSSTELGTEAVRGLYDGQRTLGVRPNK